MPTELPTERTLRPSGEMALDPTGEGLAIEESPKLIASTKVEGTAVYDRAGEQLGTILNVMLDKVSGQVAYAVLSFGGFLGVGEQHHPLPWRALTYHPAIGGYVVEIDRTAIGQTGSGRRDDEYGRDEGLGGEVAPTS